MRAFLAVVSADHSARGQEGGFIQVCHGKKAPLQRMQPNDHLVVYSPTHSFSDPKTAKNKLQAFTALGVIAARAVYQVDMGGGFTPFRRDVHWHQTHPAPIHPLLDHLTLTAGKPNWGYQLRFGLLEISLEDHAKIARAMRSMKAI